MSMHVVGFVPPDDEWNAKVAAVRACRAAGVEPPEELERFLGLDPGEGQEPDDYGRQVAIDEGIFPLAIKEWKDDTRVGYEVRLSDLPPEIKVVRFYCSY